MIHKQKRFKGTVLETQKDMRIGEREREENRIVAMGEGERWTSRGC